MASVLERIQQNIAAYPDLVVLRSAGFPRGLTYRQLDEMSGRVCRYLTDRGIGKEDFVMVLMPREVTAYVSVLGIWKSGAAMILSEEGYSSERVDFIRKDLNCKLVITPRVFEEMMTCEPCTDYPLPAPHDACYATYTSGSTGKPKGILHEFGKLELLDYDYRNERESVEPNNGFAIITPLPFGPSLRNAVTALLHRKCLFLVEKAVVENPTLLLQYFIEHHITETSATASLVKAYSLEGSPLKNVFVHSEPGDGLYKENLTVINLYTLSEVVFPIATFRIDKPYDRTPLGYPNPNVQVKVVNEQGTPLSANQVGEIIVENPFTRGYIHLPDQTKRAFQKGFFYTGDLGYWDETGLLRLCGRRDDMIKINGNRAEPAEIENAVKKVLGISSVLAKGFSSESRSFIAAYLLRDKLATHRLLTASGRLIVPSSEMKDRLKPLLPNYMIPTYYVVLDAFPKNASGKIARSQLPQPVNEQYCAPYEAPQTEQEAYFCHLFEKVLGLSSVGVNDDFYQIGGDSLSAITAVAECDAYELTVSELFAAGTARKLATLVSCDIPRTEIDRLNREALTRPQPLSPEAKAILDSEKNLPGYTGNYLTRFFRLYEEVDVPRFTEAVDVVLKRHPMFATVIQSRDGDAEMVYRPDRFCRTETVAVNRKELQAIQQTPPPPFETENALLYRRAVYLCEGRAYFYLCIHHIITDGTSLKNLLGEIADAYVRPSAETAEDYAYLIAQRSAEKADAEPIFEPVSFEAYQSESGIYIRPDSPLTTLVMTKYETDFAVTKDDLAQSDRYQRYHSNVFFLACFLKTIAKYNQSDKVFSFWVYHGRDEKIKQNAHMMLIQTMPIAHTFDGFSPVDDDLDAVKKSVDRETANPQPDRVVSLFENGFALAPYFLYQQDVLNIPLPHRVFETEWGLSGSGTFFEFHLIDNSDEPCLRCLVKYAESCYRPASVETFCRLFEETVKEWL